MTNFEAPAEQIRLVAVSVIAGFGARSLLPRMVGHLEKQVANAIDKAGEAKSEAERATQEAREANEKLRVVHTNLKLLEVLDPNVPLQYWQDIFRKARVLIDEGKAPPALWINAARVLRWHNCLEDAISLLDETIKALESGKIPKDQNYPIAYFNRACYYALRYASGKNTEDARKAVGDLEKYLHIIDNPSSQISKITADQDLGSILKTDEFEALAKKYG